MSPTNEDFVMPRLVEETCEFCHRPLDSADNPLVLSQYALHERCVTSFVSQLQGAFRFSGFWFV